jgi:hypothetical protein
MCSAQSAEARQCRGIHRSGTQGHHGNREIRESLQDCIDQGRSPSGLEDEVEEVAGMMVCNSVISSLYLSLTTFRKLLLDSGRLKRQCKLGAA